MDTPFQTDTHNNIETDVRLSVVSLTTSRRQFHIWDYACFVVPSILGSNICFEVFDVPVALDLKSHLHVALWL